MTTFKKIKEKGYQIEVNTTGAMIVDTIDPEHADITDLDNANYTQKNVIYDDIDQAYDLVDIATGNIVFSTDDYDKMVAKIEEIMQQN